MTICTETACNYRNGLYACQKKVLTSTITIEKQSVVTLLVEKSFCAKRWYHMLRFGMKWEY